MSKRRRALVLLLVLVSLALLGAFVAPLALLSAQTSLVSAHAANNLRHRMAVDSLVRLLPELLARDVGLRQALDRQNSARLRLRLEAIELDVVLQDDTAKLPVPLIGEGLAPTARSNSLRTLAAEATLPALDPQEPDTGQVWSGCLEDLFVACSDQALYGRPGDEHVWARYLSPLGNAIQWQRAPAAVLEAALADLQPGLGLRLAQVRGTRAEQPSAVLARLDLPEPLRRAAQARLTTQTARYSLLIRSHLGDDVRQHYVICTVDAEPFVLLDWEVAP